MWYGPTHRVALVVDDEHFARLFAVQILLDEGFVVLEAADAQEAMELLASNDDVSVVLTDISMPGDMDGYGLAQHVASAYPDAALILASGVVLPGQAGEIASARFLPKPFTASSLTEALHALGRG